MHVTPQLLKDLENNPYIILEKLSIKEIESVLKLANKSYHVDGTSILSDTTYDTIQQYLKQLVPDHPLLQTDIVGAIPSKNKVKLPIFMGSLNKIRDDEDNIRTWRKAYTKACMISDKLDGVSCLLRVQKNVRTLYSRGNGHMGQDITHLSKYVQNVPATFPMDCMVRGELIISKKDWEKIKHDKKTARNTVAGLANTKKPDPQLAKLMQFVAYELVMPELSPEEGMHVMEGMGFKVVHHTLIANKDVTADHLSEILIQRRQKSEFEIDGIVVHHNALHDKPADQNPAYAFAFKSILTHDRAEVVIKDVLWKVSKHGLLKPVVEFETVKIAGANIRRATAHNARMVEEKCLGPGSRVVIIRSGDVIPTIHEVLAPSSSGVPSLPNTIEYDWVWNENHVEIRLKNPEDAIDYTIRQMENYVSVLGVSGLGSKIIAKLYHQGIDTIRKLVNITKVDLYKATYSSKLTMKIFNKLQDVYRKGQCIDFMVASNIFGAGLGRRKLKLITETIPKTLSNDMPTLEDVLSIKGVGEKNARQFIQYLHTFHEFMEEVGLPCRTSIIPLEETPEGFMVLQNKTIVFTGFRSKELEEFIQKRGGKVATHVSSHIHMVIAKDPQDQSIKSETAKELGIPILDLKTFQDEIGYVPPTTAKNADVDEEFEAAMKELDDAKDEDAEDEDDDEEVQQGLTKKAECIRHALNWSSMKKAHVYGKSGFDSATLWNDIEMASPKLLTLLQKIQQLDNQDMAKHGTVFKHMIFSDVLKRGFGAKIIAAGLHAIGFRHVYNKDLVMQPKNKHPFNTFAIVAKTQVFTKPLTVKVKNQVLQRYNDRPGNVNGKDIRVVVLDTGYKEGIDLFDVKYVHLFEPLLSYADEAQAIGRATRYCGQKGLHYEKGVGWKLHVFKYDHSLVEDLVEKYGGKTSLELIYKELNKNTQLLSLSREMEEVCKDSSVDRSLTSNMHGAGKVRPVPTTQMSPGELETFIEKHYGDLKWTPITGDSLCTESATVGPLLEFSPSQKFVREYFTPANAHKGMLLWHSLGSGKTCTAVATASFAWEIEDYTIAWITRGTLRSDVYKNMFDNSCVEKLRDYIKEHGKLPDDISQRKRLLSKSWLPPMSYKQFNNTLQRNNRLYDYLVKKNGYNDPLRKTLLIIDEAHLMLSPTMKEKERLDIKLLQTWLRNSYEVSGKQSARVLLMTATPIVETPFDVMKLLNLTDTKDLPDEEAAFVKRYLDPAFHFTPAGKVKFQHDVAGRISYLNILKDRRRFVQPVVTSVEVPISTFLDMYTPKIESLEGEIALLKQVKIGETKKQLTEELDKDLSSDLSKCETLGAKEKKDCVKQAKEKYKDGKKLVDEIARETVAKAKEEVKEKTDVMKGLKLERREAKKEDRSVATVLAKTCFKEKRQKKSDPVAGQDPEEE